jgi:urease accessory protein
LKGRDEVDATTAMRWRILQLADSAFPTGAFAHSGGLEAAVHFGEVSTAARLEAYVRDHLWNVGNTSLPFVADAHQRPFALPSLDVMCDATLTNHVANRASRAQGRAFVTTCKNVFGGPSIQDLASRVRQAPSHLAPAFGAVLRALDIPRAETRFLFGFVAMRGVLSAAVRIGAVGPHEAQRMQRDLGPILDEVLEASENLRPIDAATTAPIADLVAAAHDRIYSRLFQS